MKECPAPRSYGSGSWAQGSSSITQTDELDELTVLLPLLLMVECLCVLRSTDDPSSHSQTNATYGTAD
jgi:hypothetical protein